MEVVAGQRSAGITKDSVCQSAETPVEKQIPQGKQACQLQAALSIDKA